jgi:exodeoxyribonuclease VII large subunit
VELFSQANEVLGVKQLTGKLRRMMREGFSNVRVAGEISGLKTAASGHAYFNLKEEDTVLACTLFRNSLRLVRFPLKDGLMVQARGAIDIYEQRGSYQLNIEHLEPLGAGALQKAFEELKERLKEEGLFDAGHKRELPKFPRRIGIVTSPTGAVIQDMLNIFERRCPGLEIQLYPALVQGPGSAEQVCEGILHFSDSGWADVVIVARGGGSLEDLWSFNEEIVARAIFASHVPVVSAVGHETDFTIADFTADLRAPTPSAAAEIVAPDLRGILDKLTGDERVMRRAVERALGQVKQGLSRYGTDRARAAIELRVQRCWQRLDETDNALERALDTRRQGLAARLQSAHSRLALLDPRAGFARKKLHAAALEARLTARVVDRIARAKQRAAVASAELEMLSPLAILARGYAVVFDESGLAIRQAAAVAESAPLRIRVSEGEFAAIAKSPLTPYPGTEFTVKS